MITGRSYDRCNASRRSGGPLRWSVAAGIVLLMSVGCNLMSRQTNYSPDMVYPPNRAQQRMSPPQQPGGMGTFFQPQSPTPVSPPDLRERPPVPQLFSAPGQNAPTRSSPTPTFAPAAPETLENNRQPLDPIPLPETSQPTDGPRLLPRLLAPSAGLMPVRPSSGGTGAGWIVFDVQAPQQAPQGSTAPIRVIVKNVGQKNVESLSIACDVPQGVTLPGTVERSAVSPVRRLIPGEATELKFQPRSDLLGRQTIRLTARFGNTEVASRVAEIDFVPRQVELRLVGPNRRSVGQRAEFNVRVANLTSQPLQQVQVRMRYDSPLTIKELTLGGRRSEGLIEWTVGDLRPDESIDIQAEFECRIATSEACVNVSLSSDEVLSDEREVCLRIDPSATDLQVDLSDESDPVRQGETCFVILTARNGGLQPLTDIRATLQLPAGLKFEGLDVVVGNRQIALPFEVRAGRVNVAPVAMLLSGETARFRYELRATQPGAHALRAYARHAGSRQIVDLTEPVNVVP